MIPAGVLLGLIAMLGWGIADFLAARALKTTAALRLLFWTQSIGLLFFLCIMLVLKQVPALSWTLIIITLFCALASAAGYMGYYKGLEVGKVSIICPLSASWAIVTVLITVICFGESLTMIQGFAVLLVIAGGVLASFRLHDLLKLKLKRAAKGVGWGVLAMVAWGLQFAVFGYLVKELGWFLPLALLKLAFVAYMFAYIGIRKQKAAFPKKVWPSVLLIACLEFVAWICAGLGLQTEYTSIVAPVSASFPILTILLARVFLKEKLERNQLIGVIAVIAGILVLAL
jgi:drug/metabolite transporter (DMT)-like permease